MRRRYRQRYLGRMLVLALAVHAGLIAGLRFAPPDPVEAAPELLDITLVTRSTPEPVQDADYLAQQNLDETGTTDERVPAMAPPPGAPEPEPQPAQPATPPSSTTLATEQASAQTATLSPPQPALPNEAVPEPPVDVADAPPQPAPDAARLVGRSLEIAALAARISESMQSYAERPREKRISARTQEYLYAAYMQDWVAKVERVGNLNYPDEARRRKLSGRLLLDVALDANGAVRAISVLRSSGERVLDDAALRIVKLAAPYAEFPPEMQREIDVLHIIRTWEFLASNRLFSR